MAIEDSPYLVIVKSTFVSVFTIKRPKGTSAARACGVLMLKILNKCISRSDISSNQCKFMFAILLQLLLSFLNKCVFAYVIRIVDLSFICK